LLRNGILLALGVIGAVGAAGGPGVLSWTERQVREAGTDAGIAALLVLVTAHFVLSLALRAAAPTAAGQASAKPSAHTEGAEGWPVGSRAPLFSLPDVHGTGDVSLTDLLAGGQQVLLFMTSSDCAPCTALLPELATWQEALAGQVKIAVAASGGAEANRAKATEYGLEHVLLQHETEVTDAYRAAGTPAAVLIDSSGRIATAMAAGAPEIRALVRGLLGTDSADIPALIIGKPTATRLFVGDPAPTLYLPDTSGEHVDLRQSLGRMVVVVFWSPTCGYCDAMRDDLAAWAASRDADALKVLLVSAAPDDGPIQPILVDEDGATATAFGSHGTPSAFLIDAEGRIAADVAVGADEVLALLRRAERLSQLAARLSAS
jgi:peroxiredoxin